MVDYVQSNEQIIAALMAGSGPEFALPTVDQTTMHGGGAGGMMPGGTNAARMGGALGDALMNMQTPPAFTALPDRMANIQARTPGAIQKGIAQRGAEKKAKTQQGFIDRSVPQDMRMAEAEFMQAGQDLQNTQTRRFRGGILGLGESIFDLVRSKGAKKEFIDARQTLEQETMKYQDNIIQQEMREWTKKRNDYVRAVVPMLETRMPMAPGENPEQYGAKIEAIAAQGFNQGLSIEKMFPDGPAQPVKQTYINPADQTEWTRYIDSRTGLEMKGEGWQPFQSGGASSKTTGQQTRWGTVTEGGIVYDVEYSAPDENGKRTVVNRFASEEADTDAGKEYETMSGETQTKLNLSATASQQIARALPYMFSPEGNWDSAKVLAPNSHEKAAYNSYSTAVKKILRQESGAVISAEDIETMAESYIPLATDGDITAMRKVQDFMEYARNLTIGYSHGYNNVPESSQWVDGTQPWMDTQVGQQAKKENDLAKEDAALTAELQAALDAAGIVD